MRFTDFYYRELLSYAKERVRKMPAIGEIAKILEESIDLCK